MTPNEVFTPGRLGPLTLRNRVIKAATFEGMSRGGLVSDELIEYHRRPAAGGVAMTTLAYCAVSSDGRTYKHQIHMRDEARDGLRRLTDAVHGEGALAAVQLGHAGWFSNPKATKQPNLGPSRVFSPYALTFSKAMTPDDLERVRADYARAALLAVDAGFDALEIHMGHGYLLSQFLSPYTNRRNDDYGGSIENRARFLREVANSVRDAVGRDVAVYAKLNMADGFKNGLELHESVHVARLLAADGALDALELTGGFTARTPMFLMRGDVPLQEMIDRERDPVRRLGIKIFGRRMIKEFAFEEAFFLPYARQFLDTVDLPLILLGGINRLDTMNTAIAEGFQFVAMARALLREPDLLHKLEKGSSTEGLCIHCNKCVAEMEVGGTRCVFLE
jgi:2,4-dienoyl-CoA reductase-like NADH-dependent reductase (Old Yellow Enzyme family)